MPVFLTASVILLVSAVKWLLAFFPGYDFIERAELFTYDWRARVALAQRAPIATNLALICADDYSVRELNQHYGNYLWPWPRNVYGMVVRELKAQGAAVVGIDGFLTEHDGHPPDPALGGLTQDEYLAREMKEAGNVVVPTMAENISVQPPLLQPIIEVIRNSAWAVGHDGLKGLNHANADRLRSITAYVHDRQTRKVVWQMAVLMAARALELDLENARFEPGRIIVPRRQGLPLKIPVDSKGQVYIDWVITPNQYSNLEYPFSDFYRDALRRELGEAVPDTVRRRLVLVGFTLAGNTANDWGANPVSASMPQCYAHLNVLNSLVTGRYIVRASAGVEILLIAGLAILSAVMGWRLRVSWSIAAFCAVVVVYLVLAVRLYVNHRYWLPVAAPMGGAFAMGYICLLSYRAIVEREHRQVRSALGKVVSPNVFNLLIRSPSSALDTCRRKVTVYFADVRGFTRYMEDHHARTLKKLAGRGLHGAAAEAVVAQGVGESLDAINRCLGEIADVVKAHDGTLDKYIGDCVMSFWGAPVADERHAVKAVNGAIAVHRALHAMNLERVLENERRQKENIERLGAGLAELDPLAILRVGSALNSGMVTVGFMGSLAHVSNYTVFGRDVNIASRLEGVVEPDCILVTESTFLEVRRYDPELAESFVKRDAVFLHGISHPVQIYEVPWNSEGNHRPGSAGLPAMAAPSRASP